MSGECEKRGAEWRARTMRNDEGGEGDYGEGMKREGRNKMAWKERRARGGEMDKTGACSEKNGEGLRERERVGKYEGKVRKKEGMYTRNIE